MDILRMANDERGSVFITTMLSVLLMTLLSGYAYQLGTQDMHFVNRLERAAQAQQLAEAGLHRMFRELKEDWDGSVGDTLTDDIGPGEYSVEVDTIGERYLVVSTGEVDGVTRTLTAEVTGGSDAGNGTLDYAIAGGGNVSIDSGTAFSPGSIDGSVYAGGDMTLDGPSNGGVLEITENTDAGGSITASGTVTVSGEQNPSFSSDPEFPTVDMDYYKTIAQANGTYFTSDLTYTSASAIPSPVGGVIYTTGNITVNGTHDATVCLVAAGNITMSKSGSTYPRVDVTAPANLPAIVASGNITFSSTGNGQAYFRMTGLTYAGGNFTFSTGNLGEFTIIGSIQAQGNVNITPTAQSSVSVDYTVLGDLGGIGVEEPEPFGVVSFNQ